MNDEKLNLSVSDYEVLFERIGSTMFLDTVYIFLIAPIGFIGFFLNILTLYVLFSIKQKQTKLYEYLKLYSLISILMCLIVTLSFMSFSARYYSSFMNNFSRFYRSFVITSVLSTFSLIIYLTDILLALDRLSIFIERFKILKQIPTMYLCLVIVLTSVIINLPVYFSYYVKNDKDFYDGIRNNLDKFSFTGRTSFFYSKLNYVFTIIGIVLRDVIALFLEIFTSLLSVYYYKIYESKSNRIFNLNSNVIELVNTIMNTMGINNNPATNNNDAYMNRDNLPKSTIANKKFMIGKQIILMTMILSFSSIISHVLICVSFLIGANGPCKILYDFLCISLLFLAIKHSSNIFIFYNFNSHFNKTLRTILTRKY
jgi:hypothetical protein